jgi:hypothetical protein
MSYFPTKVLLATDGSEEAAPATEAAVDLARGAVARSFSPLPQRGERRECLRGG